MKLLPSVALLFFALAAFGQAPTVKQAPPPGIPVPASDAAGLREGLAVLQAKIAALANGRDRLALVADAEVFHKAVRYALEYDEFFKPAEMAAAREQLRMGSQRADELAAGLPAWPRQTGPVVRAYRSRIDHSVQPYGLIVPEDWSPSESKPRPLYLWFHGRNEKLTELAFIESARKAKREFAPAEAFELHLYGRYCNASKFAGEIDAFEAIADVSGKYLIDRNRVAALGFSMGGATVWHLAAHYPGKWAVASPGAGFAETAVYAKVFGPGKETPPPWEQKLWRWYDATVHAANLGNLSVLAYSGEIDPQIQSAEIMEKFMAAEDLKLERFIGPNTAHKYEPETKKKLSARIDSEIADGSDPYPKHLRFVTYTLRYHQLKWLTLDRLEQHWERAEIDARLEGETLRVKTKNVAAFSIDLPKHLQPTTVAIDGRELTAAGKSFCKLAGQWQGAPPDYGRGLSKRPGLSGPIDDAFLDAFIFVRPTGRVWNEQVGAWSESELDRAIAEWRRVFRGDARVKNDRDLTAQDIASSNLILWGDPGSNEFLAKILPNLPLQWSSSEVVLGRHKASASDHAPILIFPNPANRSRYVVLNSSFTFRPGSTTSNSLQTPKLPDWALIDLREPASAKWPGRVAEAGFFDEHWNLSAVP